MLRCDRFLTISVDGSLTIPKNNRRVTLCHNLKLNQFYKKTGARVVVDSAFASHKSKALIKSHQSNIDKNGNVRQKSELHRAGTSVRQLSEWGMRGLQGSFPRLKDDLLYEERGERKLTLFSIIYLYNFRAVTVGQNQIKTVFMGLLEKDVDSMLRCAL